MRKSEVIGQEEAWARLTQMAREDRLPHAMMLCGPQGAGKMALAMAFANYLLCRNHTPDDEACEACPQCKMLARWEHPDLHFTFPTIKLRWEATISLSATTSRDSGTRWSRKALTSAWTNG